MMKFGCPASLDYKAGSSENLIIGLGRSFENLFLISYPYTAWDMILALEVSLSCHAKNEPIYC